MTSGRSPPSPELLYPHEDKATPASPRTWNNSTKWMVRSQPHCELEKRNSRGVGQVFVQSLGHKALCFLLL